MKEKIQYSFLVIFVTVCFSQLMSQEVPEIIHFGKNDYKTNDQIWMITEDCNGYIYAANSSGILIFNGFTWKMLRLPRNAISRSVYTGNDCRVYVGGYQTFGYIDFRNTREPVYVALSDSSLVNTEEEIWSIFGNQNGIIFQSFSDIWYYDYSVIEHLKPPTNIMLGNMVGERFYIPMIGSGMYELTENGFSLLNFKDVLPPSARIAAIAEGPDDQSVIVATQQHGIYTLRSDKLTPISGNLNKTLKVEQINRVLRSSSGMYMIGTIVNGLYITDSTFNIQYHLNKSLGLSNNTVLSLYEDSRANIVVGLDKGLNYIELNSSYLYYYDNQDAIGAIFDACEYRGNVYLATNKGVFIKEENGNYQMMEGSQGQAWKFLITENGLLCGHNSGTYRIDEKGRTFSQVCDVTGGWDMELQSDSLILQSTYSGLIVLKLDESGKWRLHKRVEGGDILIKNFEIYNGQLIGLHPHYGMYKVILSEDYDSVNHRELVTHIQGKEIDPLTSLVNIDQVLYLLMPEKTFVYSNQAFHSLDQHPVNFQNSFDQCILSIYQQLFTRKRTNDVPGIFPLNEGGDSTFLIADRNGYYLTNAEGLCAKSKYARLEIESLQVNETSMDPFSTQLILGPYQNDLIIKMKKVYPFQTSEGIQFQFSPWSNDWLEIPDDGILDFRNLNDGVYTFRIKYPEGEVFEMMQCKISARWYESWPGFILFLILISTVIFINSFFTRRKHQRKTLKLLEEREKELEAERLKHENEKLERQLHFKSQMLANDTMKLIQKNNMLNELKLLLANQSNNGVPQTLRIKMLKLINNNINNDENWEIFEMSFNEVHEDFFNRLNTLHPKLTMSERKLAAYIRMDLPSKEIAPLLNISVRSVENKRYRLRKKLGLQQENNLKEYILKF